MYLFQFKPVSRSKPRYLIGVSLGDMDYIFIQTNSVQIKERNNIIYVKIKPFSLPLLQRKVDYSHFSV